MSDPNVLTTLSDAAYLNAPEYKAHVESVLASYDHPTGILGELVSQMADAFWWVKIYRAEKNNLVVSEMTDRMITKTSYDIRSKEAWVQLHDLLTKAVSGKTLTNEEQSYLDEVLASEGHTLQSLRTDAFRFRRESFETIDRLIERQLKNVRLLMQSYDSVRFAPQVRKKMALAVPMNGFCLTNIISGLSMLPSKKFEVIVESTPLVSIDLVVRAPDRRILLGKRVNRPAQGYWFVPGGRILKDECVKLTFKRLLDIELAIRPEDISIRPLGIYQHFYPDNFSGDKFGTHYVVLAYEINLLNMPCSLPNIQHSDYKWFEEGALLQSNEVHYHTKWYFMKNKQADFF